MNAPPEGSPDGIPEDRSEPASGTTGSPSRARRGRVLDLAGVRRGDEHLERAARLDPDVTRRPVPVREVLTRQPLTASPMEARPMNPSMKKMTYTVAEAAELVGYHRETLARAIRAGALKAAGGGRKGAEYRISGVELERWWKRKGGGELFPSGSASNGSKTTSEA